MKFDQTDLKIIRNLQRDARINFAEIAEECDVSIDTVIKRFNRLKKNGIVKGTTILINPRSLNYECIASFEVDVDPGELASIIIQVREQPGIIFCTATVGMHNMFAVSIQNSMKHLSILKENLKALPHVRDVQTSIWVDEILLCPQNFELDRLTKR